MSAAADVGAAPLAVRSAGSLLRGRVDAATLVETAAALGYGALGLADRDGLYAAVRFAGACAERGLRPVLGVELPAGPVGKAAAAARFDGPPVVRVFARDRAGWSTLCRLVTARHLDAAQAWDEACAVALESGTVHVVARTVEAALALLAACRARGFDAAPRGGTAHLWLGAETPGGARGAAAAAARLGIPAVATGRVVAVAHAPAGGRDADVARLLTALRRNTLVARIAPADALDGADPRLAGLEPAAAWRARWQAAGAEGARLLAANAGLIADCDCRLELGVPRFPVAPVPAGVAPYDWLRSRCEAGMARRYASPPAARAARRRLGTELETIDRLGYTPYFTLVADIVGFAVGAGIPSVGRGSGAASIVSYLLGITNVDPLRYRLAFERFLHAERRDCPDLDIDLCWIRRDEVIAHVYRTYGADRVAMISTQCVLGGRGAFREAARAHGVAPPVVDRLARFVPREGGEGEPDLARRLAAPAARLGIDLAEPGLAAALVDTAALVGVLDHLGMHPCGLVIADTALTDYTALEEATRGLVVTQHEMRQIEALGLVKMDLLGNRALTEIGDTIARVSVATGGRVVPRVDPPPDGDPTTAAMLAAGDALGVFQLESPGMRNLLRMLDTRTLDDAIAAVALIRPGPAGTGMKELYVRRKRGLAPVTYGHRRLEPVLAPQRGVLLYEEDVMAVVAALCDVPLAQGDLFRRALGGTRSEDERGALRRWFAHRARAAGLTPEEARAAWGDVARFGAYAFCRAHAAGYGVLAWQAAYLRAHWPAAFASALADHHAGMYALWVHVADAQRHGVRFLLPCVQRSGEGFTLEGDPVHGPVRVGLSRVRELSRRTIERTLAARARVGGGGFASLADWLGHVRPGLAEAETLVRAGAFDWTGRARASLLVELGATGERYRGAEDEGAFRVRTSPLPPPDVPEFAPQAKLLHEWNALELGVTAHPLAAFAPGLWPPDRPARARAGDGPPGFDAASTLGERIGRHVRVTGLMAAGRRVPTRSGPRMFFLTLDDGTGLAECTLFPGVYAKAAAELGGSGPFVVEGVVESQYGEVTVTAVTCLATLR